MSDSRRFSDAVARNTGPILEVLRTVLPAQGLVLEIGAGTGEHGMAFAEALPDIQWLSTDADGDALASMRAHRDHAGLPNLLSPVRLDVHSAFWPVDEAVAVFSANMLQVSPYSATEALVRGAAQVLNPGAPLILYGPFFVYGEDPAPSNVAFDASLKATNPEWGVPNLSDIESLAFGHGFNQPQITRMPANNLMLVLHRTPPHPTA